MAKKLSERARDAVTITQAHEDMEPVTTLLLEYEADMGGQYGSSGR